MQVFKAYFKIIKKNWISLTIYLGIFLLLVFLLSAFNINDNETQFYESKANVAVFNDDEASPVIQGLKKYLSENANIVEIKDDNEAIQDALFFREIVYVVRIPKGFSQSLVSGSPMELEKVEVPLSAEGVYVDNLINRYLNTAKIYLDFGTQTDQKVVADQVSRALNLKTEVTIKSFGMKNSFTQKIVYYFNYIAYSLYAVLILGVSTIMLVFNSKNLKMRNESSPLTMKSFNSQILLGNFVFMTVVWLILVLVSIAMYHKTVFTTSTAWMLLNSFVFALSCLSVSFLIGSVIKKKEAQPAIANVLTLGTCFIGGVFVPQYMLDKNVLTIASFTPTYWYIKANERIGSLVEFSFKNIWPIVHDMLIVLGFAVAILAVTLVITKYQRRES